MVDETGGIVLMDLGVLKFIGTASISDTEEKQFVGTLRYAPPEFLTRSEENTLDGWKAINYYQIGGVVHDLVMKKELFTGYDPYPNLVRAILNEIPTISSDHFPYRTVQLVRNLLVKDYKTRLSLGEKAIRDFFSKISEDGIDSVMDSFLNMSSHAVETKLRIESLMRTQEEIENRKGEVSNKLIAFVDECFSMLEDKGVFNKIEKSKDFSLEFSRRVRFFGSAASHVPGLVVSHCTPGRKGNNVFNFIYKLDGDLENGYIKSLHILIRLENDENNICRIFMSSMFLFLPHAISLSSPDEIILEVARQHSDQYTSDGFDKIYTVKTYCAFDGTLMFDEVEKNIVAVRLLKIIQKALAVAIEDVNELLLAKQHNLEKGYTIQPQAKLNKTTIFSEIE